MGLRWAHRSFSWFCHAAAHMEFWINHCYLTKIMKKEKTRLNKCMNAVFHLTMMCYFILYQTIMKKVICKGYYPDMIQFRSHFNGRWVFTMYPIPYEIFIIYIKELKVNHTNNCIKLNFQNREQYDLNPYFRQLFVL